jgi:ABC-type antimicrobial peptide transport system permease subunit
MLAAAVALSAALIVCVCCATATIHRAINHELASTIGAADARIKAAGNGSPLDQGMLGLVQTWPEVADCAPRMQATLAFSVRLPILTKDEASGQYLRRDTALSSTALASTFVDGGSTGLAGRARSRNTETRLAPPPDLIAGRLPRADDEVAIDSLLAYRLSYRYQTAATHRDGSALVVAEYKPPDRSKPVPEHADSLQAAQSFNKLQRVALGDELEVVRQVLPGLSLPGFRAAPRLRIVGIAALPPLGGRPTCYMTVGALTKCSGQTDLTQIDILTRAGVKPDALVAAHRAEMPRGLLLETTERVTSGLDRNIQSSQLGMVLAAVMAFMSAAFIITTGLTTNVGERQRELAILRCIGGSREQLARTQLLVGIVLGTLGAIAGLPLGVLVARVLAGIFREELPTGLAVPWYAMALGAVGSVVSGVIGAAWPAWRASRMSPLAALGSRAQAPKPRGLWIVAGAGLALVAYQAAVIGLNGDGQTMFWMYATSGLPGMLLGYFLLGVPAVLGAVALISGAVSRALGLPRRLLARTIQATPYRHGLTAGALMGGLALMVGLWASGGSVLRDWLGNIQFPDAFVSGLNLTEQDQRQLDEMTDIVKRTCAITLHPVEIDLFGVRAIQKYKTTFVAFEPEAFFALSKLSWVQGDPDTALRRLRDGGAVIVAREFLVAQGLGVGQQFVCSQDGVEHRFEIVGVVASPGLEIVSKFFNVGDDYTQQAIHAVFGSRDDLKAKFFGGREAPIQLIQVQFADSVKPGADELALDRIRERLLGSGILDVGSGRQIKDQITTFARGTLLAISTVAIVSMIVACFGVANIIAAGIDARQFEFGVLRAVGAQRGLLARLIVGEALIIALTAAAMGTLMGLQGSWADQRLNALLLGMSLHPRPPLGAIAFAWSVLVILTLAAALPSILRLNRKGPRELLGAIRG